MRNSISTSTASSTRSRTSARRPGKSTRKRKSRSAATWRRGCSEARAKLISFGTEMYSRGLDKSDELEADRLGVVIAARGGYDAYGLPAVLQTLQAMNAEDSAVALMFKTHPAPAERLDALGEKMQPTLDADSNQPQLPERFTVEAKAAR